MRRKKVKNETIDTSIADSPLLIDNSFVENEIRHGDKVEIIQQLEKATKVRFSEEQRKVIEHYGKPLNVMACAGAGKSTVVINKMFYLEKLYNINPRNILAITYNTDASVELQTRYKATKYKLNIKHKSNPTFKTFHALFYMLLKKLPKYAKANIVSESQFTFDLLKHVISDGAKERKEVLSDIMKHRGTMINKSISLNGIDNVDFDDVSFRPSVYTKVVTEYEKLKKYYNCIDFDDMMVILLDELNGGLGDTIRNDFRQNFSHVFIDEFQDISKLQLDIMDNLIEDYNNFTTIGDDDQSIYSFRGSEPKYIRDFIIRYPNAVRLFLGDNYRCKNDILQPIIPCIEKNKNRVDKEIRAFNSGGQVNIIPIDKTVNVLANKIKQDIENKDDNNYTYDDFAILVRLNSQRMIIADILAEEGVPLDIGNMNYSLRNNTIYKNTMKIIKSVIQEDNNLFAEVGHIFLGYANKNMIKSYANSKSKNWYDDIVNTGLFNIPKYTVDFLKKLHDSNNAKNSIGYTWRITSEYYENLSKKGFYSLESVHDIFSHLFTISSGISIKKFFASERIKEQYLDYHCGSNSGVQIKTLHSVKGLEFKNVYLVGVDGDKFPNELKMNNLLNKNGKNALDEYLEEERRLMYVGQTRAVDNLTISYKLENPSLFLFEMEGLEIPNVTDTENKDNIYNAKLNPIYEVTGIESYL